MSESLIIGIKWMIVVLIAIGILFIYASWTFKKFHRRMSKLSEVVDKYMVIYRNQGLDRVYKRYSDQQLLEEYKVFLDTDYASIEEEGDASAKSKFLEDEMDIRKIDYQILLDEKFGTDEEKNKK